MTPPATQLVIPCYNEEKRLDPAAVEQFLARFPEFGVLFVNDGSQDGTPDILRAMAGRLPHCEWLDLPHNQGKAEAVRQGMLQALALGAEFVGFWDADLATPLEAAPEFRWLMFEHPHLQIVLGSRVCLLGRRIERKASRHYLGRFFATAVSALLQLAVYDTQCGAKLFRASPKLSRMLERPFHSRWIFDVELLARFLSLGGTAQELYELPLQRWRDVAGSKLKSTDFLVAVADLGRLFWHYRIKDYSRAVPSEAPRTAR